MRSLQVEVLEARQLLSGSRFLQPEGFASPAPESRPPLAAPLVPQPTLRYVEAPQTQPDRRLEDGRDLFRTSLPPRLDDQPPLDRPTAPIRTLLDPQRPLLAPQPVRLPAALPQAVPAARLNGGLPEDLPLVRQVAQPLEALRREPLVAIPRPGDPGAPPPREDTPAPGVQVREGRPGLRETPPPFPQAATLPPGAVVPLPPQAGPARSLAEIGNAREAGPRPPGAAARLPGPDPTLITAVHAAVVRVDAAGTPRSERPLPPPAPLVAHAATPVVSMEVRPVVTAANAVALPPPPTAEPAPPTPQGSGLLSPGLPLDLASLEAGLQKFLGDLEGTPVIPTPAGAEGSVSPWLLAVTMAATACEVARRQLKRSRSLALAAVWERDPSSWQLALPRRRQDTP